MATPDVLRAIRERVTAAQTLGEDPLKPRSIEEWQDVLARSRAAALANTDPAFAAFIRATGVEEAEIKDNIQFRIDQANQRINRQAAGFERDKQTAKANVSRDFENRGLFHSGGRLFEQEKAATRVDTQRLESEARQREALEEANRRSRSDLTAIGRARQEEELAARERAGQRNIERTNV